MDFDTAQSWFRDNRIRELSQTNDGLRFLKLRSLSRREHLYQLFASAALTIFGKNWFKKQRQTPII